MKFIIFKKWQIFDALTMRFPELAHVLQDFEEKLNGFVAIHFICSLFIRIQKQSRY